MTTLQLRRVMTMSRVVIYWLACGGGAFATTATTATAARASATTTTARGAPRSLRRASTTLQAVPTRKQIGAYAAPVAALNLANFVMGSVDTAAVGRFGSTAQLAALAPGTMGMEYTCYGLSFLLTATLNLLSSIPDPDASGRARWDATLADGLRVAVAVGAVHGGLLFLGARPLAAALGASPLTIGPAAAYLRIRAFSTIAFHASAVACAAHFARKDSTTPLATVLVAGVANAVGDRILCPLAERAPTALLPDAIAAAAVATAAAQALGAAFALRALATEDRWPRTPGVWDSKNFRGAPFLRFGGAVTTLLCWRIAVYAYVGRCANLLGTAAGAAQQITATLFWGTSSLSAEPMYNAAQTFLPNFYDSADPNAVGPDFRKTLGRVFDCSLVWGAAVTCGARLVASDAFLSVFARDAAVLRAVPRGPILSIGIFIAPMLAAEGALVALGDFGWLTRSMAISALASMGAMKIGTARTGGSVALYWYGTLLFTFLRLALNAAGVARHVKRAEKANPAAYYGGARPPARAPR